MLPTTLPYKEAIEGSASANMLLAGMFTKNWKLVGEMMQNDRFHQPYRAKLVPHLAEIEDLVGSQGAYGTALSGAGPTVLCLVPDEKAEPIKESLVKQFPAFMMKELKIDNEGSKAIILSENERRN